MFSDVFACCMLHMIAFLDRSLAYFFCFSRFAFLSSRSPQPCPRLPSLVLSFIQIQIQTSDLHSFPGMNHTCPVSYRWR